MKATKIRKIADQVQVKVGVQGAPIAHPVQVLSQALSQALSQVRVQVKNPPPDRVEVPAPLVALAVVPMAPQL